MSLLSDNIVHSGGHGSINETGLWDVGNIEVKEK